MAHAGLLSRSRAARNNQYQLNPTIYTQVWLHSPDKRYFSYCPIFASEHQGFRVLGNVFQWRNSWPHSPILLNRSNLSMHSAKYPSIRTWERAPKTNLSWLRPRTNLNDQCQKNTYFYYNISPKMVAPFVAATIWRPDNSAQAIALASVSKTSTLSPEHSFVSRKWMWLSADN